MISPDFFVLARFSQGDSAALEKLAKLVSKDYMLIIEIGSWIGTSTFIMAKVAAQFHGKILAVDHWQGSSDLEDAARRYDVLAVFLTTARAQGYLGNVVIPIITDSLTASRICQGIRADLIFIDGNHIYPNVLTDLSNWYGRLKGGGILCGHDCEGYYSKLSAADQQRVNERPSEEYTVGIGHHGVIKALHDFLKEDYQIMPSSTIWYHIKGARTH